MSARIRIPAVPAPLCHLDLRDFPPRGGYPFGGDCSLGSPAFQKFISDRGPFA